MEEKDISTSEKVEKAIRFIKAVNSQNNTFVAYSGGKDSVVLDYLCKEAGVKIPLLHNVTTIDPKGTLSFCQHHGAQLIRPRYSFLDLVEKKGFPTMFRRFCCEELKEKYIGQKGFFGIRKNESLKRKACYDDVSDIYYYTKKTFTERFFPLLYFTAEDIANVVNEHSLECHPIYYNQEGKFDVTKRLGCIGCPLQGDRGKKELLQHPILLKQILRRGILYHRRKGRTEDDAALNLVYNLFYSNNNYKNFQQTYQGLFNADPWEILNNYFLLDRDNVLRGVPKPKF